MKHTIDCRNLFDHDCDTLNETRTQILLKITHLVITNTDIEKAQRSNPILRYRKSLVCISAIHIDAFNSLLYLTLRSEGGWDTNTTTNE